MPGITARLYLEKYRQHIRVVVSLNKDFLQKPVLEQGTLVSISVTLIGSLRS